MNILINESPLLILPSLAKKHGLNEAVFLQQLHFRLRVSRNWREGQRWVYKTYEEWQEEFPFWSRSTIRRIVEKLEAAGFVITSLKHNKHKTDHTKWYRLDYAALGVPEWTKETVQNGQQGLPEMSMPITKEQKNGKKEIVGIHHDEIIEIIGHLNSTTGKQFKPNAASTRKLLNARLAEGYGVEDFKKVIDTKAAQWQSDEKFRNYLRPSTLFNATNFENYVNEAAPERPADRTATGPVELDFGEGMSE